MEIPYFWSYELEKAFWVRDFLQFRGDEPDEWKVWVKDIVKKVCWSCHNDLIDAKEQEVFRFKNHPNELAGKTLYEYLYEKSKITLEELVVKPDPTDLKLAEFVKSLSPIVNIDIPENYKNLLDTEFVKSRLSLSNNLPGFVQSAINNTDNSWEVDDNYYFILNEESTFQQVLKKFVGLMTNKVTFVVRSDRQLKSEEKLVLGSQEVIFLFVDV